MVDVPRNLVIEFNFLPSFIESFAGRQILEKHSYIPPSFHDHGDIPPPPRLPSFDDHGNIPSASTHAYDFPSISDTIHPSDVPSTSEVFHFDIPSASFPQASTFIPPCDIPSTSEVHQFDPFTPNPPSDVPSASEVCRVDIIYRHT